MTVIRGASLYRANEGTRLAGDDIVETDAGKSAQLEDGAGTLVALGPQTRVLLGEPVTKPGAAAMPLRISVLSGWLKVSRAAGTATAVSIAMPGLDVEPANGTPWSIVAMAAPQRVAMFAEAGDDTLTLAPPVAGQPPRAMLRAGQYAERAAGGPLRMQPRVSPEFIAGMPVGFRDALVAVSARLASRHDLPAALRAVDYADVSDWLASDVSARGTFLKRFRPRLKSAEFRRRRCPSGRAARMAPGPAPAAAQAAQAGHTAASQTGHPAGARTARCARCRHTLPRQADARRSRRRPLTGGRPQRSMNGLDRRRVELS